jgi:sugar phosphate isomerase/epimerase
MNKNESMTRRTFTASAAVGATAMAMPAFSATARAEKSPIKMYKDLGCGHLGVSANQKQAIDYAAKYGFPGVDVNLGDLMKMGKSERQELLATMKAKDVKWGTSGLSVQFRNDDAAFQNGLKSFPEQTAVLKEVGCDRVATWIMPGTDHLTYLENFKIHATRLRECAKILEDHDIRLGLEFVGPVTLRNRFRYPFVHTQKEMLELCAEIGTGNMGLLFDSFHWYTSHGTVDEILTLTNKDIVLVHVNDGRPGRGPDEQIDGERALPAAHGVIDIKAFMNALQKIGYDGPVSAEPFDNELRQMDDEKALQLTSASLDKIFAMIEV